MAQLNLSPEELKALDVFLTFTLSERIRHGLESKSKGALDLLSNIENVKTKVRELL